VLPHWESFKKNMLSSLFIPTSYGLLKFTDLYELSLDNYKLPDIYEFSKTPFHAACERLRDMLIEKGMNPREAEGQYRVITEEGYAVMTFEQQGCRIIRPSADLVTELMNTDTNFKLTEVIAPWPHVYIEFPANVGLTLKDFYTPEVSRDVKGVYVTWAEAGPEVQKLLDRFQEVEQRQPRPEGVTIESRYGDWNARFIAHTVDDKRHDQHNQTVRFFNMRWMHDCPDNAQDAYREMQEVWHKNVSKHQERDEYLSFDPAEMESQSLIFNLVVNLFVYMSLPQGHRDVIWRPDPERERLRNASEAWNSKRRRNLRNRIREEMRPEVWEVGQTITIQRQHEKREGGIEGEHGSVRTHWRRGHLHNYWVGAKDSPDRHKELRYLRPILVMGAGPVPTSTTVIVK